MDEINKISPKSFAYWVGTLNVGHKRLWIVFSIVWTFGFLIPSAIEYYNNINYCNNLDFEPRWSEYSPNEIDSKKCNIKKSFEDIVGIDGKIDYFDRYTLVSTKYDAMPILWAVMPPLVVPIIIYLIIQIGMWVFSGYREGK